MDCRTEELLFSKRFSSVERKVERLGGAAKANGVTKAARAGYTPLPKDDRLIALAALQRRRSTTPDALRDAFWVDIHDNRPVVVEDAEDAESGKTVIGPFIFQGPLREQRGLPTGCYQTVVIVALPAVAHVAGGSRTAAGEGTTATQGAGALLEYPCITACQQMLQDYFAPFISAVCIAKKASNIDLGLSTGQSRAQAQLDEKAAAARRGTQTASTFFQSSRQAAASYAAATDTTNDSTLIIVSLRAWQLALHAFVATYTPFGSSTFLALPPVGLQDTIDRMLRGEDDSVTVNAVCEDGTVALPSIVDLILRYEAKSDIEGEMMTIGNESIARPAGKRAGAAEAPPIKLRVIEDVSARLFGANIPSCVAAVTSIVATRNRHELGKPRPPSSTVTFVVIGLSNQASSLFTGPEVNVIHHRREIVNAKQKLFASNSASTASVLRHAQVVEQSANPEGSPVRGGSSKTPPPTPSSSSGQVKAVEATFIQAVINSTVDESHCRLVQIPSANNMLLQPGEGKWRESAHKPIFNGSLEVVPIMSRPSDKLDLDVLRGGQILVQFSLELDLDLTPAVPMFPPPGARSPDGPLPSVEAGSEPCSKAVVEWMTVKLDFHNKTTIVPDTVEVTLTNPQGPPSVNLVSPSRLEWTLPKKQTKRHGAQFRLQGTCVINSPVERTTTMVNSGVADFEPTKGIERLTTVEYGDVPVVVLDGPVHKGEGADHGKYSRLVYRCPIPLVSATVDFEMTIPDRCTFTVPCEILDINAFAEAIGTADGKANPFSAGSIKGGCTIEPSVVVRSASGARMDNGETTAGEWGEVLTDGASGTSHEHSNRCGYMLWNQLNDGGYHLPRNE